MLHSKLLNVLKYHESNFNNLNEQTNDLGPVYRNCLKILDYVQNNKRKTKLEYSNKRQPLNYRILTWNRHRSSKEWQSSLRDSFKYSVCFRDIYKLVKYWMVPDRYKNRFWLNQAQLILLLNNRYIVNQTQLKLAKIIIK